MKNRTEVNQSILAHYKTRTGFGKAVTKPAVPSFTRHNGRKIKRLQDSGWRSPRGLQYSRSIVEPKIGYRRSRLIRSFLPDGVLPVRLYNLTDLLAYRQLSELENSTPLSCRGALYNLIRTYEVASIVKNKLTLTNNKQTNYGKLRIVAVISKAVGGKKRAILLDKAKELNLYLKITK